MMNKILILAVLLSVTLCGLDTVFDIKNNLGNTHSYCYFLN